MKIQIIMNFALPVPAILGGAVEKRWHGLARELSKRHEVVIYSRRYGDLPAEQTEGRLRFVRLPGFGWSNTRGMNLLKSSAWSLRVARHIERGDAVIMNDVMAPILLPRLRRGLGLSCIDVQRMPKWHYRWLYGHLDRLYCVSSAIVEEMERVAPQRLARCARLPNSTDLECYCPLPPSPALGEGRCEILYVGRIHPEKGLDVLVRALPLCRNRSRLHLRMVGPAVESSGGDAGFAQRLQEIAREAGLRPEEWSIDPPVFQDRALADIYRSGDVFVYPSRARFGEASPIAVLEAMACGKPCVVSGLACFRDAVHDDDNGLIVPTYEPADWAAALDRLAEDPQGRARMGERSRDLALEFSPEKIARRLEEDLARLIAQRQAGEA